MSYYKKFNAKEYWANKPICVVCKKKKCKSGNICHECQKEANWKEKSISPEQLETLDNGNLVKEFHATEIQRTEANPRLKSVIGYLKDCAVAVMRSSSLKDVSDTKDVSIFKVPQNIFPLLSEGKFSSSEKEAFDIAYKLISQSGDFDLFIGTLFIQGHKIISDEKKKRINAPLLLVPLEVNKSEKGDSVEFSIKEDTVHLNQALIADLVEIKDENELDIRFQDLYGDIPEWPIDFEKIKTFFSNLKNYFPELVQSKEIEEKDFTLFGDGELSKENLVINPVNLIILAPKQNSEGSVVEELSKLLENILGQTALDSIFLDIEGEISSGENVSSENLIEPSFEAKKEEVWHELMPFDLSEVQKKILSSARKNKLTVVSGPPGTGKSFTTAAVIIDHLLQGKRVLFCSKMNKAVEVIVNSIEKAVGFYAVAKSGTQKAQRGLADKLELITGPNSPVKEISGGELKVLREKYAQLQKKIARFEEDFLHALKHEKSWANIQEKIYKISTQISQDVDLKKLSFTKRKAEKLKEKIKGAGALINEKGFYLKTWWGNFILSGVKRKLGLNEGTKIEELIAVLDKKVSNDVRGEIEKELGKFDAVHSLWQQLESLNTELREIAKEILRRSLLGNLYLIVNNHQKRIELKNFIKSLKSANPRQKRALQEKVNTETLLAAFPCWASTANHLSHILPMEAGMFDIVIFDEASQCDLASAAPALYRGNRAMIVGDPKQLTHVVFLGRQAEFAAFAKYNVPIADQTSYRFSQNSLFDVAENKVEQKNYFMLNEHFRSDPHIISFSNNHFYEGGLRIMTERPKSGNEMAIEIEYVDGHRTEGAANQIEIDRIFGKVQEIISFSNKEKPTSIGILSPFRDQVNAITKEIPKYLNLDQVKKHEIVIGTAHSLQGDEKDVVILSLSIDPDYHHGSLRFLENPNVFNVAITRAKKKLIVISSVQIKDLPNGILKDFFLHAETSPDKTLSIETFDSKFEQDVAKTLQLNGFQVWPQYESAGFHIDLVIGDGETFIAVECDGPTHFDHEEKNNYEDIWRQKILERAGWRFFRICYRDWDRDRNGVLEKIHLFFNSFK